MNQMVAKELPEVNQKAISQLQNINRLRNLAN
jgi:hypothetical protein